MKNSSNSMNDKIFESIGRAKTSFPQLLSELYLQNDKLAKNRTIRD